MFGFRCSLRLFLFPLLYNTVHGAGGGSSWSYSGPNGPSHWHTISAYCAGQRQSPINIDTSLVSHDDTLGEITLHNFEKSTGLTSSYIKNNGHTIQVDLPGSDYFIEKGGLGRTYKVVQFHFHWGSADNKGSEHTMNGMQYPMEVHFVSYAVKYPDITTAVKHSDGLAVLGFFFEVGESDNANWTKVFNLVDNVMYDGTNTSMPASFTLMSLLPTSRSVYYRYLGSLTTPGCNEVVTWTVFKEPIKISATQMAKFRQVFFNAQGAKNISMVDNFRPVQDLQNRVIYTLGDTLGGATGLTSGLKLIPCLVLLTLTKNAYR